MNPGDSDPSNLPRSMVGLYEFFSSYRFPVLMIAVLLSFEVFQLSMLAIPTGAPGLGAFAEEFRVWCYGLDQQSGQMETAYVLMFLAQPVVMSAVLFIVWKRPILEVAARRPRATLPYLGIASALVITVCVSLVLVGSPAQAQELGFPAEQLRLSRPAHDFTLTNHAGEETSLGSLKGNVVVVTGVYTTCGHTCPLIMSQIKGALFRLTNAERRSVRVLAVTLDPARDTIEILQRAAERYQVQAPAFQFLGGTPADVDAVLDRYEISRTGDPMTGQIDHANLFFVIDRQGNLAYRLTLGEQQERWLVEALRLLVAEPRAGA